MKRIYLIKIAIVFTIALFYNCSSSSEEENSYVEISPVVVNLEQVPYEKLSDYKFFKGQISNLEPSFGVIPFKPASELFTDYAEKSRFVWLPSGVKATYVADNQPLNLPVGSALIKNFFYTTIQPSNSKKIIETRVMIKKSTGWIMVTYVWNDSQDEAFLNLDGDTKNITFKHNNEIVTIDYEVPGQNQCAMCHSVNSEVVPIGIKPQNLNTIYSYPSGTSNQLSKWKDLGILENTLPANIVSTVDYNDTSKSLDTRVRSYFDIQCAHCHQDGGFVDYISLRMAFSETIDPSKMGVCVGALLQVPGIVHGKIVEPNNIAQSTLYYMLSTNSSSFRMPRVGRTIVHQEGLDLVAQWINSLENCN